MVNGTCYCQFNYYVQSRPENCYIKIAFYNLVWKTEVYDIFNGTNDCSKIFDFSNAPANFDAKKLKCQAINQCTPTQLKTTIKITSSSISLLKSITKGEVKMSLKKALFTQDCVEEANFSYTIDFPPASTGCNTCGY